MVEEFYFRMMEVFWNQVEVDVAQHRDCTKCHRIVYFRIVAFMLYEFRLHELL